MAQSILLIWIASYFYFFKFSPILNGVDMNISDHKSVYHSDYFLRITSFDNFSRSWRVLPCFSLEKLYQPTVLKGVRLCPQNRHVLVSSGIRRFLYQFDSSKASSYFFVGDIRQRSCVSFCLSMPLATSLQLLIVCLPIALCSLYGRRTWALCHTPCNSLQLHIPFNNL